MKLKQRPLLLILVMTASVTVVTGVTVWLLYGTAIEGQTLRLVEAAQGRAQIIETLIRHNLSHEALHSHALAEQQAIEQITAEHSKFSGIGESGEFLLGKKQGDEIEFLLSFRAAASNQSNPVQIQARLAEPMRRALNQESGTIIARDYRQVKVLAAYQPINGSRLGVVAKIDLAEIRSPFVRAGLYSAAIAMLAILLGAGLFLRITQPMIRKVQSREKQYRNMFDSSEKKFKTLFNNSTDAFMLFEDGKIIDCNQAALQMFACNNRNDIIGKHPAEFSPLLQADGRESVIAANEHIRNTFSRGSDLFEWTHQRLNGETFSSEILLAAVDLGEHQVIQANIRDITERKKIERELERQRILFEAVFRDVPDAMLLADLDRQIIMYNPALTRIFGYDAKELVGRSTSILYKSKDEFIRQGRERFNLSVTEKLKPYTVLYRRKNGDTFSGETVGTAIHDTTGETIAFIGVIRDITERKEAEQKLLEQKTELEASNRELESYSYSIAHDLRSPLRAITGFSQILMEDAQEKLSTEQLGHLRRIVDAGKNMSQLIDEILELSRITRQHLQFVDVDLSHIAQQLFHRLEKSDPKKIVQWQVDNQLHAMGDATLLKVALQNLIDNAWKFTRGRQPAVIKLGMQLIDNTTAYYVKDNGVGFDMDHAENLFKPFHRLHPREFEGTGIGLATIQRIVHRHGGRVWVEAQENVGATFYFTLAADAANIIPTHDAVA